MGKIEEFLAETVLVEQKLITYRYVSRALKVNVNVAKKALFEFYTAQNAKKPGSLHATYLLYGTKSDDEPSQPKDGTNDAAAKEEGKENGAGDDDVAMEDSVPDYLLSEKVPTAVITLVAEANLEATLSKYETLEAIHVYSLSTEPTTDLQLLADSSRQLRELPDAVAPEDAPKTVGTISNPHVRRRERKGQPPVLAKPSAPAVTAASVFGEPKTSKTTPAKDKTDAKPPAASAPAQKPSIFGKAPAKTATTAAAASAPASAASSAAASPAAGGGSGGADAKPAPAPPKKAAGGIMAAFAKGATMPKPKKKEEEPKKKKEEEPKPKKASAVDEYSDMVLSDDGVDDDDEDDDAAVGDIIPKPIALGQSRDERMQNLRQMMWDREDDPELDDEDYVCDGFDKITDDGRRSESWSADENEAPAAKPPKSAKSAKSAESAPAQDKGPSEIVSSTSGGGRRRGKKRVMKKKMVEDENGYLVTLQEEAWESFSEDEAPPPKAAPAPAASSAQAKAKKMPAKKGQGNIMSFFGKK